MLGKISGFILVVAALFLPLPLSAALVGTQDIGDFSEFGTLDLATGQFNVLYFGPRNNLRGLAFDPTSNLYYGVEGGAGTPSGDLFAIDLQTQQTVNIGTTGVARLSGLTYDSVRDQLLGVADGNLHSIDRDTGVGTLIGFHGIGPLDNIAFNPFDGYLYGTHNLATSQLLRVDPVTGAGEIVTDLDRRGFIGLAIDPETEIFYGADLFTDSLYSIDPLTGVTTLIGPSSTSISGLTFGVVPVPEPTGLVLFLVLGHFVCLRRN